MIPKFRAWIKDYQVMRSVEFLAFNEKGVAEVFTNPIDGEPEDFRNVHVPKQIILMQSTGLKDCNDKEIYEGDILKVYSRNVDEEKKYLIIVAWDEEAGAYTTKELWGNEEAAKLGWDTTDSYIVTNIGWEIKASDMLFEVVGNIYENPELLEEVSK